MKSARTIVTSSPGHAGNATDRNLPWRNPAAPPNRRAGVQRVARNSPVPFRISGADPLEENPPIASAAATRALPRPHSGEAQDDWLRRRFVELADRWREETEFHSAASALFMHPAYQEIIGLGPAVLPLMLADLEKTRDHWFWALRAITGENPVPAAERGKVERMAERWVDWGRARGLL